MHESRLCKEVETENQQAYVVSKLQQLEEQHKCAANWPSSRKLRCD